MRVMRIRSISILLLLVTALAAAQVQFPSGKKEKEDPTVRIIQGVVKDADDAVVAGAVVQLKNTKTLQVRSFITKSDGKFVYNNMARDVDFELRAEAKGMASASKMISTFDNRKIAITNLKLDVKIEKAEKK